MKTLLCVFAYFCWLKVASSARFFCPENELWARCMKPCQATCQNPYVPRCNVYTCRSGCLCRSGFVRDEVTGKCVSLRYCPPGRCPENEVPNTGRGRCEPTCQNQESQFQCSVQNRRCVCKRGFVREIVAGRCIRPEDCPQVCEENAEWCESVPEDVQTCQNLLEPQCLNCANKGPFIAGTGFGGGPRAGCICKKGFILDEDTNKCVTLSECPGMGSTSTTDSTSTASGSDEDSSTSSSTTTAESSSSTTNESSTSGSTTTDSSSTTGSTTTTASESTSTDASTASTDKTASK